MSHTPTPWHVETLWHIFGVDHKRMVANCGGHQDTSNPENNNENEANAHLIVQSVNSHAQLVDACKAIDTAFWPAQSGYSEGIQAAIEQVHAALLAAGEEV